MTREEAITVLKALSDNPLFSDQYRAAFSIAIHDIKVHHDWDINNLILINKDNYEPIEQEPIIDKIRAEILRKSYGGFELGDGFVDGYNTAMVRVLNILDKYKAESEE